MEQGYEAAAVWHLFFDLDAGACSACAGSDTFLKRCEHCGDLVCSDCTVTRSGAKTCLSCLCETLEA